MKTKSTKLTILKQTKFERGLTILSYVLLVCFFLSVISFVIFFLIYIPKIKDTSNISFLTNYDEAKLIIALITIALTGLFGIIKIIQYGIYLTKFERQLHNEFK